MKNHYVSQLILKRFSNVLYIFDDIKKAITKHTRTSNIFYKTDIYSDAVEEIMNTKLENDFAKLLDEKILNKDIIEITRSELLLLKKYLLVCSIKTKTPDEFLKSMQHFKDNSGRYLSMLKQQNNLKFELLASTPSITDINDSAFNLQMRAMELFINYNSAEKMLFDPLCTKEFYTWAKVFLDAFLVFCDSHDTQEFILTDNGMTTEYEPSYNIFSGISLSKHSYLQHQIKNENDEILQWYYYNLLLTNQIMFENFNIFNLSSTRCIMLVNPFFRLYDEKGIKIRNHSHIYHLEKPNIWPSIFETRTIVNTPENIYSETDEHSLHDKFIYSPCKLSIYDTIYI